MERAAALERERERRAALAQLRAERAESLRSEALRAAEEVQRRPLFGRLAAGLAELLALRRTEFEELERLQRERLGWQRLGLSAEARRGWTNAGFSTPEGVRRALDVIEDLMLHSAEAGLVLGKHLSGPASGFLEAVVTAVAAAPPADAARALLDGEAAFLWRLPTDAEATLCAVAMPLVSPTLSLLVGEAATPAWRNYALAHALLGDASFDLASSDLTLAADAVLDELIDRRLVAPTPDLDSVSDERRWHILARISPEDLTDAEVKRLVWPEELHRRALASRKDLESIANEDESLYRTQAALVLGRWTVLDECADDICAALRDVRDGATPPETLLGDRTLWQALSDLVPDVTALPPSEFAEWCLLRRVRSSVLGSDWATAHHLLQIRRDVLTERAIAELDTALAYMHAAHGEHKRALSASRRAKDTGRLFLFHKNVEILEKASDPRRINPYLVVGVQTGDAAWESAWRRRFVACFRSDPAQKAELNWAKLTLQAGTEGDWFLYPVRGHLYETPRSGVGYLRPSAQPRARQTPDLVEVLPQLYDEFARESLATVCAQLLDESQ